MKEKKKEVKKEKKRAIDFFFCIFRVVVVCLFLRDVLWNMLRSKICVFCLFACFPFVNMYVCAS